MLITLSRRPLLLQSDVRINLSGEFLLTFFYQLLINSLIRERRAPFSPAIVKRLIKHGVKVIVQPSNRRAYPMQARNKSPLPNASFRSGDS